MSKNYFSIKTGHEASDKYFKFAPIWHDSDIIKAWAIGTIVGISITLVLQVFLGIFSH